MQCQFFVSDFHASILGFLSARIVLFYAKKKISLCVTTLHTYFWIYVPQTIFWGAEQWKSIVGSMQHTWCSSGARTTPGASLDSRRGPGHRGSPDTHTHTRTPVQSLKFLRRTKLLDIFGEFHRLWAEKRWRSILTGVVGYKSGLCSFRLIDGSSSTNERSRLIWVSTQPCKPRKCTSEYRGP